MIYRNSGYNSRYVVYVGGNFSRYSCSYNFYNAHDIAHNVRRAALAGGLALSALFPQACQVKGGAQDSSGAANQPIVSMVPADNTTSGFQDLVDVGKDTLSATGEMLRAAGNFIAGHGKATRQELNTAAKLIAQGHRDWTGLERRNHQVPASVPDSDSSSPAVSQPGNSGRAQRRAPKIPTIPGKKSGRRRAQNLDIVLGKNMSKKQRAWVKKKYHLSDEELDSLVMNRSSLSERK